MYSYGTAGLGDDAKKAQLQALTLETLANDAKAGVPGAAEKLATQIASGTSTVEQAVWDAKAMALREAAKKTAATAGLPYVASVVEQMVVATLGPRPSSSSGTKTGKTATGQTVLVDVQTGKQATTGGIFGLSTTAAIGVGAAALLAVVLIARR